jgi:ABC-type glycerol-3-phosphate transport system substrate-binding protein
MPVGPKGRGTFLDMKIQSVVGPAPNPEAGWEWLKFHTSPEGYALLQGEIHDQLPLRKSLIEHPQRQARSVLKERNILAAQNEQIAKGRAPHQMAWFDEAQVLINAALNDVWTGKKTALVAMKEIEGAVNEQVSKPLA